MLLACGKNSGTLSTQMVSAAFSQIVHFISLETDPTFLSSLYKCFCECIRVVAPQSSPSPASVLPQEVHDAVVEATKRQLQNLADKRKARANRSATEIAEDKEDLMLIEEMEEFALEDMGKMIVMLDSSGNEGANHPLMIAISSVRDLGMHLDLWDSEDEGISDD